MAPDDAPAPEPLPPSPSLPSEPAPAAAAAVGCELGAIVKSLLFLAADSPIMVLAPGDRQVADAKLAALLGVGRKKIRFADAESWRATRPSLAVQSAQLSHISK